MMIKLFATLCASALLAGCASSSSPAGAPPAAGAPSAAARMICAEETRSAITEVLGLDREPSSQSHWADDLYTCTYRLPMGALVLSVKESPDAAAGAAYLAAQRVAGAEDLAGLTDTAFGTPDGAVVLLKDADTLRVDASGLPAVFGAQHQKRADFAYEIASDVLGCWTGEDGS